MQQDAVQKKAKKYARIQLILSLSETLISMILIILFVICGYARSLELFLSGFIANPYLRLLAFAGIAGGVFSVIFFPFSFISGFWLEHYFRLSNQTFPQWIWEKTKAVLVGLVLLLPLFLMFYYFLRNYPESWWFLTGTILFIFSVVIGRIAPHVIFPLFYKFEKLDDPELLKRMTCLAQEGRFTLDGIFRFNMSKTTKKANAAFTGIGKSKRIILGDTLLESFSTDEIETVFAHEVGHYVHKHLLIGVVAGTLNSYLSLYAAHLVYSKIVAAYGFRGLDDLAVLPILTVILSVITFIISPLSNALSRFHERQADRYALKHSSAPGAFPDALGKLAEQNLADSKPHPVIEFLFHSHPSLEKRIRFAREVMDG